MTRFDPPHDDSPLSAIECRAVVARELYRLSGRRPDWSSLCERADAKDTTSMTTQAYWMRRAAATVKAYETKVVGIRHKNALSPLESKACQHAALGIKEVGLSEAGVRAASREAGVSVRRASGALKAYGAAIWRQPESLTPDMKAAFSAWQQSHGV